MAEDEAAERSDTALAFLGIPPPSLRASVDVASFLGVRSAPTDGLHCRCGLNSDWALGVLIMLSVVRYELASDAFLLLLLLFTDGSGAIAGTGTSDAAGVGTREALDALDVRHAPQAAH